MIKVSFHDIFLFIDGSLEKFLTLFIGKILSQSQKVFFFFERDESIAHKFHFMFIMFIEYELIIF
jgi:hypothetical protein